MAQICILLHSLFYKNIYGLCQFSPYDLVRFIIILTYIFLQNYLYLFGKVFEILLFFFCCNFMLPIDFTGKNSRIPPTFLFYFLPWPLINLFFQKSFSSQYMNLALCKKTTVAFRGKLMLTYVGCRDVDNRWCGCQGVCQRNADCHIRYFQAVGHGQTEAGNRMRIPNASVILISLIHVFALLARRFYGCCVVSR